MCGSVRGRCPEPAFPRGMRVLLNVGCRDFAANVGIPFRTPEEYFLQEDPRPFVRTFDPAVFLREGIAKPESAGKFRD